MVSNRSEHAISEVMGTILMVALVVILAAVIGALVFGLVGTMEAPNLVGVSAVKADNSSILVTLVGGEKANQLYNMTVTVNGTYQGSMVPDGIAPLPIGNRSYFGASRGSDHLVIVGWFADGSQQVIMETYL